MNCEELTELLKEYIRQLNAWSFAEWFSLIAIGVSITVFLKDLFIYKRKLRVIISSVFVCNELLDDEKYYKIIVHCILENRNQYPITITKATIGNYHSCKLSYDLLGDDIYAFGQEPGYEIKSLRLPKSLEGFKSTDITAFVFLSERPITIDKNDILTVHTTRGKIKTKINKYLNVDMIDDDLVNN